MPVDPSERPTERVGVLVVRVWIEADANGDGLRARLSSRLDIDEEGEQTSAAGSIDDIVDQARAWLKRFAALAADGDAGGSVDPSGGR
jgi:hypothetical protein